MFLTDILDELGVDYKRAGESPHVTGNWVGIVCPWCGEGTGKYGLGLQHTYGSCWKCGSHSLNDVLFALTGSWPKTKEYLGQLSHDPAIQSSFSKPVGRLQLPAGLGDLKPCHKRYLRGRGHDPSHLSGFWGVRGIGLSVRLSWRVFLPVMLNGRIVSWTTRSLVDEGTRYINAKPEQEAAPIKSLLFGQDHLRHAAIVVEGAFDVYNLGPGAVATMGVGYSKAQFSLLTKVPLRVIAFDSENMAQERARKLCDDLSPYPGRTVRVQLDAADPGSASKREVQKLREEFLE